MTGTGAEASGVLGEVAALEAVGRHGDAIDLLAAALGTDTGAGLDRSALDRSALEVALADLRHRSWRHLTSPESPARPMAAVPSPPIGETGLPEARIDDLDGATLYAAIHQHGCLLVRDAFDPDRIRRLLAAVDASFDAADRPAEQRDDPGWYSPLTLDAETAEALGTSRLAIPRKFARDAGGVLLADAPRAMQQLLATYEELGLHDIVSDYLGDRPVMSALKCTLRKVGVDETGGWHQDGAFLGRGIGAVNIWLTLSPCGVDAPGLDIVPRRFEEIVETGTRGAYFDWAVGDALVEDVAGPTGVLRPTFEAGDLLIFDEMLLHRTAIDDAMSLPRHAIEFWCFAASAYPDTHVPLVW